MWSALKHGICRQSPRVAGVPSLCFVIGILFSSPAAALAYPVSGVWAAIDPKFPAATIETCIAVKTCGVDAVIEKSIPELMIFTSDRRYDVKENLQTEQTLRTIEIVGGAFRITETLGKSGKWFGFKKKTSYMLKVIDPLTIEIWAESGHSRFSKCGPQRST